MSAPPIPVAKDGYTYLCPWPSCREPLHIETIGWENIGPHTIRDARMQDGNGETWSVQCLSGHVIWTQTDQTALDGGDVTEPDSRYNHDRALDVLERLTDALAGLTFTERCAWCCSAPAVAIGEREVDTGGTPRTESEPACVECCKSHRLVAVRTLHPQTLAEREAGPVMMP